MAEQRYGNYVVVRKLGEGGMGLVFEAVHEEIGKRAAVKVLHVGLTRDPQVGARFLTEARAVNMVQHPGIVSIFEFGRTPDGAAYLVMEYLEGETLRARIDTQRKIPPSDARRILRQIASALGAAHDKNVVHRDLKPDNVMLVPEPELPGGERAKVLDFGVAKVAPERGHRADVPQRRGGLAGHGIGRGRTRAPAGVPAGQVRRLRPANRSRRAASLMAMTAACLRRRSMEMA